jgi:copper chaperone
MDTLVLKVTGMSCGGCVGSVTRVLQELPGVVKAEVSLEKGEAAISYDSGRVARQQMVQAIEDAGFEAE